MRDDQIILEQIGVAFGKGAARVNALSDVSLTLDREQMTLVMGPSGSGKTTLLSVIGCLLTPDCGAVSLMETARGVPLRSEMSLRATTPGKPNDAATKRMIGLRIEVVVMSVPGDACDEVGAVFGRRQARSNACTNWSTL